MDFKEQLHKALYENKEHFEDTSEEMIEKELTEDDMRLLKRAFLEGFLASSPDMNGRDVKVLYKNSHLKPDTVLWDRELKEGFNKFMTKIKRWGV